MAFPVRVSISTFNIWGDKLWPERFTSLTQTISTLHSDIYLLQEVAPALLTSLDTILPKYERVKDDPNTGWYSESNIYWNSELYTLLDHGWGDLELEEYPKRGLFWIRLAVKANPEFKLFVSTVHFPWVGNQIEIQTGMNQRIPAALKAVQQLRRLVPLDEAAIIGGDFNDDYHPVRILNEELGYIDVFESMDLPPPITHPVRPSIPSEEMLPNRTLDWIMCSLPSNCRVISAFVKTIRGGSYPPASDHFPVTAIIELK